jgi:prokaryotic YEATS domain
MSNGDRWTRSLILIATGVCLAATGVVLAIFLAPRSRAAELVDFVTGMIWPSAILLGVVLFWPEVRDLMAEVRVRVQRGGSFGLGPLTLGELPAEAAKIPSPATGESVRLDNIALLHTSFVRPDKTRGFNDGRLYYQFEVIVMAPDEVMDRIASVTYHLSAAWPAALRERTTTNRSDRFKMKDLANGTSIVTADVSFKDGATSSLQLNRFIDLRPDGPRFG